tara:strand:- start:1747 stop:2034 length:288 start_codon:yes stop_codon:yes gene_type:complete
MFLHGNFNFKASTMKNGLVDLNNHLFVQLERLGEENLKPEKLADEIKRGKAISDLGKVVVENAKLALDAEKFKSEFGARPAPDLPEMLVNKTQAD